MTITKCVPILRAGKKIARESWKNKWLAELPGTGKIFLCSRKDLWATTATLITGSDQGSAVKMDPIDPSEICVEYWTPDPVSLGSTDWKEV